MRWLAETFKEKELAIGRSGIPTTGNFTPPWLTSSADRPTLETACISTGMLHMQERERPMIAFNVDTGVPSEYPWDIPVLASNTNGPIV